MILFRKVKSFTLIEMIIVMLLSGILMGGIYWVFASNGKLFAQTLDMQSKTIDKTTLFYVLQSDFTRASDITVDENQLIFSGAFSGELNYSFEDERIIRTFNSKTDTFAIPGFIPEFYMRTENALILYIYDTNTYEKYPLIKFFDWSDIINTDIEKNGNRTTEYK